MKPKILIILISVAIISIGCIFTFIEAKKINEIEQRSDEIAIKNAQKATEYRKDAYKPIEDLEKQYYDIQREPIPVPDN